MNRIASPEQLKHRSGSLTDVARDAGLVVMQDERELTRITYKGIDGALFVANTEYAADPRGFIEATGQQVAAAELEGARGIVEVVSGNGKMAFPFTVLPKIEGRRVEIAMLRNAHDRRIISDDDAHITTPLSGLQHNLLDMATAQSLEGVGGKGTCSSSGGNVGDIGHGALAAITIPENAPKIHGATHSLGSQRDTARQVMSATALFNEDQEKRNTNVVVVPVEHPQITRIAFDESHQFGGVDDGLNAFHLGVGQVLAAVGTRENAPGQAPTVDFAANVLGFKGAA